MANILTLPNSSEQTQGKPPVYSDRLKTTGDHWVRMEKRLLDQAEFLEAMILVLDDVKLTNIRNRDYGMMEIVSEEIPRFQQRLDEIKKSLADLRRDYAQAAQTTNIMAN